MSIFKTQASSEMVTASDSVVRSEMEMNTDARLPGFKKTEQMNVSNVPNVKSRRDERGA